MSSTCTAIVWNSIRSSTSISNGTSALDPPAHMESSYFRIKTTSGKLGSESKGTQAMLIHYNRRVLFSDVWHRPRSFPELRPSKSWPSAVKSPTLKVKTVDTLPCSAHAPITASSSATLFFGEYSNEGSCSSDRIRRETWSIFRRNSHKQSSLPFELHQ